MAKEGQAKVLSEIETKTFLTYLSNTRYSLRDKAIWAVCRYSGLRVGSCAGLELNDCLDSSGNLKEVVVLRKSITKGSKTITAYFGNEVLRKSVLEYLNVRPSTNSNKLFITERGNGFSANVMTQLLYRHYKNAGIDGASSHSCRRQFTTELLKKGVDIVAVSKVLGHSSITTTQRYVHHDQEELLAVTKLL